MTSEQTTRIKVMCIFTHNGKTLASKGYDASKDEVFYRVLGGGLEFREKVEDGIRREIKEELLCDIENLRFIKNLMQNGFQLTKS